MGATNAAEKTLAVISAISVAGAAVAITYVVVSMVWALATGTYIDLDEKFSVFYLIPGIAFMAVALVGAVIGLGMRGIAKDWSHSAKLMTFGHVASWALGTGFYLFVRFFWPNPWLMIFIFAVAALGQLLTLRGLLLLRTSARVQPPRRPRRSTP
ncbi:hypothetical protein CGLAUT_11385 [Corynebacterium glaucum]|uniref:hypothetical protein n=1 Tax=Corynebacterium glaucum TaxID=187491 RepID=UPI0025B2A5A1|nr:hypothetical protein [Corynebacterium glaucum]WJZ08732.1 hypothetical protein CGLAUT_11385 [Corynebacterium glaucum]